MVKLSLVLAGIALFSGAGVFAWSCSRGAKDGPDSPNANPNAANAGPSGDPSALPFHVQVTPKGACVAGADCAVSLHIQSSPEFHVNAEYPYRFIIAKSANTADDLSYSQPAPKFQLESEREGTLIVPFRKATPGHASIEGTFKVSVCSKETCLIEDAPIVEAVTVAPAP